MDVSLLLFFAHQTHIQRWRRPPNGVAPLGQGCGLGTVGIGSATNLIGSCLLPEPGLELWFIITQ
jgi:hypothetical protein